MEIMSIILVVLYLPYIGSICKYFNRPCQENNSPPGCTGDLTYVRPSGTPGINEICIDGSWNTYIETTSNNCYQIKQLLPTAVDGYYLITPSGGNTITYCLGMGWTDGPYTRIHDIKNYRAPPGTSPISISDMGVNYNKLYFVDKGTTLYDYAYAAGNFWRNEGFATELIALKFNSTYYSFLPEFFSQPATPKVNLQRSSLYDTIDSKSLGKQCNVGYTAKFGLCFSEFKMHLPNKGLRLVRMIDSEGYNGANIGDNQYIYDFYIYVASCDPGCVTCKAKHQCYTSCDTGYLKCDNLGLGPSIIACKSNCNDCIIDGNNTYESSQVCLSKYHIYIYIYIRMSHFM